MHTHLGPCLELFFGWVAAFEASSTPVAGTLSAYGNRPYTVQQPLTESGQRALQLAAAADK